MRLAVCGVRYAVCGYNKAMYCKKKPDTANRKPHTGCQLDLLYYLCIINDFLPENLKDL